MVLVLVLVDKSDSLGSALVTQRWPLPHSSQELILLILMTTSTPRTGAEQPPKQSLPAVSRTSTVTVKVASYVRRPWGDWSCGVKMLAQGQLGLNRSPEGTLTVLGRTLSKPLAFALVSSTVRRKG